MKVIFDVTAEKIARGIRNVCNSCPVALAGDDAMEKLGVIGMTTVGRLRISMLGNGTDDLIYDVETPECARRFIDYFDAGRTVYPFSFPLEIPDEVFAKQEQK